MISIPEPLVFSYVFKGFWSKNTSFAGSSFNFAYSYHESASLQNIEWTTFDTFVYS